MATISKHIVRAGNGVDDERARTIEAELESRYPTDNDPDFAFKLIPLAIGAWVLLLAAMEGHKESDILCCAEGRIDIDTVVTSADLLVQRWRMAMNARF